MAIQAAGLKVKDTNSTLKAFLSNFVSDTFFSEIVSVCLYPAEFSMMSISSGNSVIEYIRTFFYDLNKTSDSLKVQNLKQIKSFISLCTTILTIRESGTAIINYDNIFQHLPNIDLSQQGVIQASINNKVESINDFRKMTDKIINSIQVYYEVCSISSGLIAFENFVDYASGNTVSVFEATKMYKDNVIQLYNDLSKLQSVNKYESEKDYFIVGDKESTKTLSKLLTQYISTGYSFLKTGYKLFDQFIEGFTEALLKFL